jgi:anthraniloyl-CoA monooxygenase
MEDAMSLVSQVATAEDVGAGLERYRAERNLEALKLQSAARNRMEWFENVARYTHLEPQQFAYSLLTASQRIGHENLRLRDPRYVDSVERELARRSGLSEPRPPMFLPLRLGSLQLVNRVVVSPMAQYLAEDGAPGDWHLMHYGARAAGGAGLIVTEMTCVAPDARITPGCTGMWNEAHQSAWKRIVDFVHGHSPAKIALQLGHAGRKGSTQLGWQAMDYPLPSGNWPLISASAAPYFAGVSQTPRAMTGEDFERVTAEYVRAASLGAAAGFDMLELHMAHGYLLASFLSPLTNQRCDAYGGPVENRLRYPLQVLRAVRAAWPAGKPLSVRISAHDWAPGGLDEQDLFAVARAFKEAGVTLLSISTGQTVPDQRPVYGRMWQTPFADMIRNLVGIPTLAVGNIFEPDHVNTIIGAGRADLCAIARPHLADPAWTLHAAAGQRYTEQWWPQPYLAGKSQLEHNLERAALALGAV